MQKLLVLLSTVVILLTACGGGVDLDEDEAMAYIDKGKEVVSLLNDEKYEKVHEMFDENMEDEMSVEDLEELTPILEDAGSFEEFNKTSIEEKEGLYGIVLVTQYSEEELVIAVSFDDEKKIAGLFIQ